VHTIIIRPTHCWDGAPAFIALVMDGDRMIVGPSEEIKGHSEAEALGKLHLQHPELFPTVRVIIEP
jgi:hypothetical protein